MEADTLAIVGVLALLVRVGHALHAIGSVRARSVAAVASRALVDAAGITLVIFLLGRTLASVYAEGDAGRAIGPGVFFASPGALLAVLPLALLPGALLCGATAERARTRGVFVASAALTCVALPLLTAGGWVLLSRLDQARGDGTYAATASLSAVSRVWPAAVAHLIAGGGAIALAALLGPRAGKYNRDGSANFIPAHSLPTIVGGDMLLAIGLPMLAAAIAGDPAARLVNALLAASAATLAAVAACAVRDRHAEAVLPWAAAIGGLVAGSLSSPAHPVLAVVLGAGVGLLVPTLSLKLDLKLRVDEPSGLALPHLLGGLAGVTGASLGAALEGATGTVSVLLLTSIGFCGGVAVAVGGVVLTLLVGLAVRSARWLRVDAAVEAEGLDLAQHDVNAYPDFQQTLIKSYHLRQ